MVGDDSPTDASLSIRGSFAEKAAFPVYINSQPACLGYEANFLASARRGRGDVVVFSDQDECDPGKLETVTTCLRQQSMAHHAAMTDSSGRSLDRIFPTDPPTGLFAPASSPLTQFPGFTLTFADNSWRGPTRTNDRMRKTTVLSV